MGIDWTRVQLTEHMTEAAALVGECQVVFDFGAVDPVQYEVKVYRALKGGGSEPYFALGIDAKDPAGFRPLGTADTAEEALERCLTNAGVHHRRLVKQATE